MDGGVNTGRPALPAFLGQLYSQAFIIGTLVLLLALAALAIDYLDLVSKRWALQGIPIVGEGNYWKRRLNRLPLAQDFNGTLQHALETYTKEGQPWALPFFRGYMIVLPPKSRKDYEAKTPDHFSFLDSVNDAFGLVSTCPMTRDHVKAVQVSVAKRQSMESMHEAVVDAVDQALKALAIKEKDQDWQPFAAWEVIWFMMIQVATAYIIGPDFGQDPTYIQRCVDFCLQASEFRDYRGMFPESVRPRLVSLSRPGRRLHATIARAKQQLLPEIRQRIARTRDTKLAAGQFRHTLLDASILIKMKNGAIGRDAALADEEKQASILAGDCLLSALEIAYPIAAYVIGMINYSIADPGYADVLRDEIRAALQTTGGTWTIDILDQMPRLESFARETVRCDTTSIFTATRRLQKPVRLDSIGRTLNEGSYVTLPAQWLHQNPAVYPDPERFDGTRFYDSDAHRCATRVSTGTPDFVPFGYGAEMCPGRDLGMRQARLAFAKILMAYDLDSYPVRGLKQPNKASSPTASVDWEFKLQWRRRTSQS